MKKNQHAVLGRSLIKDRFGKKVKKINCDSFLHTSDLNDGYDWNKFNVKSMTEENSLNEFLSTAELAGTEFTAEKLNVTFVNPRNGVGLLNNKDAEKIKQSHEKHKDMLKIPRRPKWDATTTTEELHTKEKDSFLSWRRNLALFQEETGLVFTPYEKNLDFWRQLWRVVEKSDMLVQIVDARNPLLFRSVDLECYVKEVDKNKINLTLCNKADFLTRDQRRKWAQYFDSIGAVIIFFSALNSTETNEENLLKNYEENCEREADDGSLEFNEESNDPDSDSNDFETDEEEEVIGGEARVGTVYYQRKNSSKLYSKDELINFFKNYPREERSNFDKNIITVGLVGYPNVGKSSTINALLTEKKVPVSATPGKTKHFQTVFLDKDLLLCDCPGLVMPSFVLTKADMVINGILPIDQMKDHVPPINLICTLIPRYVLESQYSIIIPKPEEGENPDRPPFSEELLNAFAYSRGFMTANGEPDNPRASRYILKDFVNGKLLYCYAPPNVSQDEFHKFEKPPQNSERNIPSRTLRIIRPFKVAARDLEYSIFQEQSTSNVHSKGVPKFDSNSMLKLQLNDNQKPTNATKSWKDHKEKRNKHIKLRVKYKCLDD